MNKNTFNSFLKLFLVILFLYLFLVSIGLMGVAFKGFGKDFAANLIKTTSNPFIGLFIGILATSFFSSSKIPANQLESEMLRISPEQKARVVHYIATRDELGPKGAQSARTLFLESYLRQKSRK